VERKGKDCVEHIRSPVSVGEDMAKIRGKFGRKKKTQKKQKNWGPTEMVGGGPSQKAEERGPRELAGGKKKKAKKKGF